MSTVSCLLVLQGETGLNREDADQTWTLHHLSRLSSNKRNFKYGFPHTLLSVCSWRILSNPNTAVQNREDTVPLSGTIWTPAGTQREKVQVQGYNIPDRIFPTWGKNQRAKQYWGHKILAVLKTMINKELARFRIYVAVRIKVYTYSQKSQPIRGKTA